MKRVYYEATCEAQNEETNNLFLKLVFEERKAKEKIVNEEDFKIWITDFHSKIREYFKLPNKVFGFGIIKDNTKAKIVVFPKEPDGNYYKIFFDEELKQPYILVSNKRVILKEEN